MKMSEHAFPVYFTFCDPFACKEKKVAAIWKNAAVFRDSFYYDTLKSAKCKSSLSMLFDKEYLYIRTICRSPFTFRASANTENPFAGSSHAKIFLPEKNGAALCILFNEQGDIRIEADYKVTDVPGIKFFNQTQKKKGSDEWVSMFAVPLEHLFVEKRENISTFKFNFCRACYEEKPSGVLSGFSRYFEYSDKNWWKEAVLEQKCAEKKIVYEAGKNYIEKNRNVNFSFYPEKKLAPFRNILGMNNSPRISNKAGCEQEKILFKRLAPQRVRHHDAALFDPGFALIDVSRIFPLFHADHNDPANYDFAPTDFYLQQVMDCGCPIEFRFGECIEHSAFQFRVKPPSDMNKWAEICVNILRHYNEGWAKGFHWNISYASLWEEPDNSSLFAGSFEEFLELYRNFSLKIKKAFPDVKVGGPQAIASNTFRAFFSFCRTYSLPLDFAGTTNYTLVPEGFIHKLKIIKNIAAENGYGDLDIFMSEWHYAPEDWSNVYGALIEAPKMDNAAFSIASLICMQKWTPMAYYYSWATSSFWGLMANWRKPYKVYYALCYYTFFMQKDLHEIYVESSSKDSGIYQHTGIDQEGNIYMLLALFHSLTEKISFSLPMGCTSCFCKALSERFPEDEEVFELEKDEEDRYILPVKDIYSGVYMLKFERK